MAPDDYTTWLGQLNAAAVDPARTEEEQQLFQDRALAWAYRGTPPASRTSIQTIALDAKPYPSVVIADCPAVSATWRVFDIKKEQAATAGVSQWDGQAAVPDDLHRRPLPVALDGPAGQHRRDAYLLGWVKGYLPARLAPAVALSLVR
jgi:hypothetical protein